MSAIPSNFARIICSSEGQSIFDILKVVLTITFSGQVFLAA